MHYSQLLVLLKIKNMLEIYLLKKTKLRFIVRVTIKIGYRVRLESS